MIESIAFDNMSFAHDNEDALFQNVTFNFPMNEIVWIKADSGQGRSSLLQLMAALKTPTGGAYMINGENVNEMSFEEFLPYRLQIGYSFDMGGLLNNKTLLENLTLPLMYHKICSPEEAEKRGKEFLNIFGIDKHTHSRPAMVPGGVRKMACVARSMIMYPQILLMDDPSVGMGGEAQGSLCVLIELLRSRGSAKHVFMSSYDDKFMSKFDHSIIYIESKQLYYHKDENKKKAANL